MNMNMNEVQRLYSYLTWPYYILLSISHRTIDFVWPNKSTHLHERDTYLIFNDSVLEMGIACFLSPNLAKTLIKIVASLVD